MDDRGFNSMNVIPLVDIMLVLLTIVLTTSTFIATGAMPVELPKASKRHEAEKRPQVIDIDKQGNVFLNSRPLVLNEIIAALGPLDRDTPVVIRADRTISLQRFVDVMDTLKNSGFSKVRLQTEVIR
ncbi:MAG: biopolymer transporter ExbD [Alphaproteobacteria bacterium]|uniref:Biopolymer transporter ExbD n=1 Tax=Candidatus Nitrobium versatile TaxID=2884831 RepID=A0A953JBP7_9BACT|nr:biopolymer transporter ExbD [Candidatus Nitrobium versatile]